MRIISGQFRGHVLIPPPGGEAVTRPITDRAKQSLFDALQDCFVDAVVLDCFAGTGSMGLECLSRGAAKCIFIERDRGALRALKENIAAMGMGEKSVVLPIDAYGEVAGHPEVPRGGLTIAFVDPPYSHTETGHLRDKVDGLLRGLAGKSMVDGGIISFRHPGSVSIDAGALRVKVVRELRYGEMGITWLAKG
jgi:16S rRNA (guanine(966)-N(2))-methyltransferase RsmD